MNCFVLISWLTTGILSIYLSTFFVKYEPKYNIIIKTSVLIKMCIRDRFNRDYTMEDINSLYERFEEVLFASLENFAEPVPGMLEPVSYTHLSFSKDITFPILVFTIFLNSS